MQCICDQNQPCVTTNYVRAAWVGADGSCAVLAHSADRAHVQDRAQASRYQHVPVWQTTSCRRSIMSGDLGAVISCLPLWASMVVC